jgi:hypothetical protein
MEKLNFNNYVDLILESLGKTLYHGSCKSKFKYPLKDSDIFGGGVEDDDSSLVGNFYGDDYTDYEDDEGFKDKRETPVFAADKTSFKKAVNAMTWCLASKKDKHQTDVTWNEIRNDGVIFVFYDTDTKYDWKQYSPYDYGSASYADEYKGLEDGDYFKSGSATPYGWWEGSKLVRMLKKRGYKFK